MNTEKIAIVCHEAQPRILLDNWRPFTGVESHLKTLESGREPEPSASHDSWLAEKRADGWKYGAVKNPETKEHPCFVPYEQLPAEQKLKDYIFCAVVKSFYQAAHTGA